MNNFEAGPSTRAKEDFDVFLNHRGPDTKATFIAHLDQALKFEGFRPFLDRQSLEEGNQNEKSIYQALDMAKVHVVVVSKGYAESEYCLDELVATVGSHKPVIPVFYDVEPKDLLDVGRGKFAEAFKNHKNGQPQEKLQKWIDALGWLAKIVGCCFDTISRDRDEAKLKQDVVNAVARKFPRSSGSSGENRRVGLKESKKEIVRKLESGRGVVGLYGMGGIGKTTLAEAVYEYYAQDFGHRSFLRDVRSSDVLTLQNQIIRDLHLGVKVDSREDYPKQFRKFKDLRVLIVVDDIDDERQFRDIILDLDKIGKGSRIIVTSRNQRVLSNVLLATDTKRNVLHEVEVLNRMESQQLFNFRAFPSKSPDRGFEDLAVKVADACGGHPLALEIAGAFLRNKKNKETDIVFWDEMIASKATRDEKLQSILKISYDNGLDNCQKIMFLDIACHLIGKPSPVALEIWASCESCGCGICRGVHISFRDLTEKCLVKVANGQLRMHDALRDMGRDIVEATVGSTKWDKTHFWDPQLGDAILEKRKGSDKVRGFSRVGAPTNIPTYDAEGVSSMSWLHLLVVDAPTNIPTYDAEAFSKMSELHLLVLDGCYVSGDFSKWSRELRLLQWKFFPLSELPLELNLAKTVVVDLSGSTKLRSLWKDEAPLKKASWKLRWLILNHCIALTTLSQDIGKRLSNLKVLHLGYCDKLQILPDSIGEMKNLEQLILRGCVSLRIVNALPHSLQHLDLGYCRKLDHLPSFEGLTSLAILTLCNCRELKEIQGVDRLTTLEEVNLTDCTSLQPGTLQLQHNRTMRSCCLSGSNVAVKYDSDWSENEPALQLITFYDNAFGFVDNCMENNWMGGFNGDQDDHKIYMEATIVGENKCVVVVICSVVSEVYGVPWTRRLIRDCREDGLDASIVREGQEVFRFPKLITLKQLNKRDEVYICTLRRTHPLVRDLKHGDKIRVVGRTEVECCCICVVYEHGEDQVISVNSRLLDAQQSREKKAEFAGLILADTPECHLDYDETQSDDYETTHSSESEKPAKFARLI